MYKIISLMYFFGFLSSITSSEYLIVVLIFLFFLSLNWILKIEFFSDFFVFSCFFGVDGVSVFLVFLSILIFFFLFYVSNFFLRMCLIFSILSFSSLDFLLFFILFELSVIPIFFVIFSLGSNPERLMSGFSLWIYTLMGGFPLLFNMVKTYPFSFLKKMVWEKMSVYLWESFFWIFGFLMKIPLFGFHKWLPLAHVEAPFFGSVVLAAMMLKLGGYGLFRVFFMCDFSFFWYCILLAFFVFGFFWGSFFCILSSDIKVLMAYSSVAHMNFFLLSLVFQTFESYFSGLMILLSHGMVSGALFYLFKFIYSLSSSRSFFVNFSLGVSVPSFILMWGLFCVLNSSVPPNCAILAEIFLSSSLFQFCYWFFFLFFFGFMMCGIFSIYLFLMLMGGRILKN